MLRRPIKDRIVSHSLINQDEIRHTTAAANVRSKLPTKGTTLLRLAS
jgi:hypothetical protein